MRKVLIAGLVLALSAMGLTAAYADEKDTNTTLLLNGVTALEVDPDAAFNAAGFVTWAAGASTHLAKGGTTTVSIFEFDDCTGDVLSDLEVNVVNGAYTAGMTAPTDLGDYGVQAHYNGKDANEGPGPALDESDSPCRVLTVGEGNGGGDDDITVVCNVPAAPAVASAWLKSFDPKRKPGDKEFKNIESLVASGNEVNDFTQDEVTERVPGWRVPLSPAGAPDAGIWEPRCLLSGDFDPNDETLFILDENPEFRPLVEAYTEYAWVNRVDK